MKRSFRCVAEVVESALWAQGSQWCCRMAQNQRWSLDFVSDALTDGRRFRILAVVDDFSRENLVLVADTSLSGHRVARELDKVDRRTRHAEDNSFRQRHRVHQHGDPQMGSGE